MNPKSKVNIGIQAILGVILLVVGSNKFLHFMPNPEMPEEASSFMGALMETGYMLPLIAITEIVAGLLLLLRVWSALALVLIVPVSLNALLFHTFLAPGSIFMALVVAALNLYLLFVYLPKYKPMLSQK